MSKKTSAWRARLRKWSKVQAAPTIERPEARVDVSAPTCEPRNLRELLHTVIEDVDAVLANDPAARHALEVVLVYPGLHALWMHRIAHALWDRGAITLPRVVAHLNRMITGIEIHPGARLGCRVFIDHGMGIVIGETAVVGDDCLIYKGAVLGGTSSERAHRHPTLGRNVVVGTNACVLGPIQLGDGTRVGANSVVIRDVEKGGTVVGVPGRQAKRRRDGRALDHADLPDPILNLLRGLLDELEQNERRLDELEKHLGVKVSPEGDPVDGSKPTENE